MPSPLTVPLLPRTDVQHTCTVTNSTAHDAEEHRDQASRTKDESDQLQDTEMGGACSSSHPPSDTYKSARSREDSAEEWNNGTRPPLDRLGFFPSNVKSLLGCPEKDLRRLPSNPQDELRRFRFSLFWCGLDQSTAWRISLSWFVALLLALIIPTAYLCLVTCTHCDSEHRQPFDRVVHGSEAVLAAVSFVCLSNNLRKYGLRRFLFLDQINNESVEVQCGYNNELNKAFHLLELILLPSFMVELVHQVWWFTYASVQLPFIHNSAAKNALMCTAVMVSWLYKNAVFLLPCILFRLMCYLQNLRFEGYIKMLECVSEVSVILREYMRLRQQLNIISHRYRMFIVLSLVTVTASQFMFLLMITSTTGTMNFFRAGNLGVCSVVQLIGFAICLHGAARITHRAQRIISIVSQWHAMSTCQAFTATGLDADNNASIQWVDYEQLLNGAPDNDMACALNMYSTFRGKQKNELASIHMRQAFVTHLYHNTAGINVFGFPLDRIHLQMVFTLELSLMLWILGKTLGFSLS